MSWQAPIPDVVRSVDPPNGEPIVGVKLANRDARAWLFASDYEAVVDAIGDRHWRLVTSGDPGRRYVTAKPPWRRSEATVARIIMQAPAGTFIQLRDGDPLNLRISNLLVYRPCPENTAPNPVFNPPDPQHERDADHAA